MGTSGTHRRARGRSRSSEKAPPTTGGIRGNHLGLRLRREISPAGAVRAGLLYSSVSSSVHSMRHHSPTPWWICFALCRRTGARARCPRYAARKKYGDRLRFTISKSTNLRAARKPENSHDGASIISLEPAAPAGKEPLLTPEWPARRATRPSRAPINVSTSMC
jgi:hypothetical protein